MGFADAVISAAGETEDFCARACLLLDNVLNFVSDDAEFGFLIKPQFEAKRNEVKKGGLIVDEDIRLGIVENVRQYAESLGLQTIGVIESPILGSKSGNKEFLIYLKRQSN